MTHPYEAIVRLLSQAHVDYQEVEHEPVYTSEQAAAVRGVDLAQGAKSLLLKTKESGFVLVVLPGDQRLDSKKLKAHLKSKSIRFATPDEVVSRMGCEIGACYPFGVVAGLPTVVDSRLAERRIISFNPGRHDATISLAYTDYAELAFPAVADVIA